MLLAKEGVRVTVVEQSSQVGGRTSAIDGGGYRFDVGPTFFMYPRILEEIFSATGHDLRQEVDMVKLDPKYRIHFGAPYLRPF